MTVIIPVPSDLGANRVGTRYGPKAILKHLKRGKTICVVKQIPVPRICVTTDPKKKCQQQINILNKSVSQAVLKVLKLKEFPVILGGDHSITFGTAAAVTSKFKAGIIWFDAHGDFNYPEISPSGNIHGMVLDSINRNKVFPFVKKHKTLIKPSKIVVIGARALDAKEKKHLKKRGVTVFTMLQVKRMGIENILKKAFAITEKGTDGTMISFDVDVIDPRVAPGVSTPVPKGLSLTETRKVFRELKKHKILSLGILELNPKVDKQERTAKCIASLLNDYL